MKERCANLLWYMDRQWRCNNLASEGSKFCNLCNYGEEVPHDNG